MVPYGLGSPASEGVGGRKRPSEEASDGIDAEQTGLRDLLGKMVGPTAKRQAVAHLRQEFVMGERRQRDGVRR